ncbi:MAG: FliM/FliN family flagellar motor switch protein [Phycisphaerales bacterium]|jgi:flagellar motor switch protein FliN/FliY|nr:FliM/FliN family flagellar motor switch protein [Phycisphaerales bacterium]
MSNDIRSIKKLEVPLVVVLGERAVMMSEIRNWIPGSIVELGKEAEEDLEVRVNNTAVGQGSAVKLGENFGIQLNYIGDPKDRITAMGPSDSDSNSGSSAEDLAAALLDGQI